MKIPNKKIRKFALYKPEILHTLLYMMALTDEKNGVSLDMDLMCDVLNRSTYENDDYIDRLVNAGLLKRTFKTDNVDIIYKNIA